MKKELLKILSVCFGFSLLGSMIIPQLKILMIVCGIFIFFFYFESLELEN